MLFDLLSAHRRVIYLVVTLASAAGVWAGLHLPSAIYPELTFPRITIVARGSSLGARQVVFSVARPIEEVVSIVPGVSRVHSRSIRGASEITVTFVPRTDMLYALQLVQARINDVRGDLPPGIDIQVERLTPSIFPILSYNLEGGDAATLYDIARYQIRPVLSRLPGVGRVDVEGTDVREIEVVCDPARLAAQGVSYDDVAAAIRQATSVDAVGRLAQDYKQLLIVTDQEAHTPEDIGNVVVTTAVGPGVRVRDLGTVSLGTADHTHIVAGDGRPAAQINITRQLGGSTVDLADSAAGVMRAIAPTLPPGVRLELVYDQAALVRDAVASVRDAMVVGAVLASIVLLVFLRHGAITAVSATSIPLTLAITVFLMGLVGQTFNLMTLGAMAIAIGLVIDDSVVITENIARHLAMTPDRHAAIRDALQELIWPVSSSTITTVVVFLPLGLLQGVVGQFFIALSVTLTIAVLVSLVLALTVIPLLAERFVSVTRPDPAGTPDAAGAAAERGLSAATPGDRGGLADPSAGVFARSGRALDALAGRYDRALQRALHHPWRVAGVAAGFILAGVLAVRFVGTGFLPEIDEGAFVLDYVSPGGTALAETDRQVHIIERILGRTPEIVSTSRRTGAELGLFATQQNVGDIVARLAPLRDRTRRVDGVIADVRGQIEQAAPRIRIEFVQILSDVINDMAGAARPVEIKLFGERLDVLERYATLLAPDLQHVKGLADLFPGVSEPSAELLLHIDAAEAARIGMTPQQVGADVSGSILGVAAGDIRRDDRSIGVRVRAPDSVRFDPLRLASLPIMGQGRRATPLGALATVRTVDSRGELTRENQQQMIAMTADVDQRPLGDVMHDVLHVLAAHPAPAGVRVEIGGQYAGQQAAFRTLLIVLGLAAVSVVIVMVVQFESFVEPLVVVLVAPVSFVGAIVLLLITKTPLNVSSFMGLILLVGLIVKNGIILLDFTRLRMRSGDVSLELAIREAARTRLRPILMTTLCTLFGLLPLAFGLGAGSELQRPLALTVIGGLALSTPITLFVVPTLVLALHGGRAHPVPKLVVTD
jgi:multidrug efflux pump subunit AcrB